MHHDSESVSGQIRTAETMAAEQAEANEEAPVTMEEVEAPGGIGPVYSGPERRAQGYLIAEILPESPPLKGQEPEFDCRR